MPNCSEEFHAVLRYHQVFQMGRAPPKRDPTRARWEGFDGTNFIGGESYLAWKCNRHHPGAASSSQLPCRLQWWTLPTIATCRLCLRLYHASPAQPFIHQISRGRYGTEEFTCQLACVEKKSMFLFLIYIKKIDGFSILFKGFMKLYLFFSLFFLPYKRYAPRNPNSLFTRIHKVRIVGMVGASEKSPFSGQKKKCEFR